MSAPNLCPWLIPAIEGVYVIRGRARFPEGVDRPTVTRAARFVDTRKRWQDLEGGIRVTPEIPAAVVSWGLAPDGVDTFEARFPRLSWRLREEAESALFEAFAHADAHRFDETTWHAPADLEDVVALPGAPAFVLSHGGVPHAVLSESDEPDDLADTAESFQRVFGGRFALRPTASPRVATVDPA
ncbi:MAG: hypothetical protein JNJ59_14940 [Deltaproteobacteria bacterium]|nr:hypothetical protein [Deltaproteobacteria bacterium]